MKSGLRIIIVDKDEKQADTVARQLKQAKLLQSWQRVSDAEQFSRALEQKPDLIIANYFLPRFGARDVLSILKSKNTDIPCIVMTNNGDSESAVECLKAGAVDYISNIHLFRLPAAVLEALGKNPNPTQQRQRLEKALRLAKYAVDQSPFPLLWFNRDGALLWGNEAAQTLLGYPSAKMSSLRISDIDAGLTDKNWQKLYEQLLHSSVGITGQFLTADRQSVDVELQARLIHQNGQEYILLFVQKDSVGVSQKAGVTFSPEPQTPAPIPSERPIDQLERLAAFGRLSGGVIHDFNNLLTVITGYCELLSIALQPDDPANAYVEQILKTCDRGASLSRQLLTFSRRMPIKHTVFDLNELVSDMATMLQRVLRENIELMVHLQSDPVHIEADAAEIEQIIVNLVVNARDAMPQGGRLLIETKKTSCRKAMNTPFGEIQPGDYIVLTIQDSGLGMSEAVKKKLFTPFFTTKPHGTGLGLATVQNYVRRCNGIIEVHSELRKGAMFKIHFPETSAPIEIEGASEDVEILPRGSETILVVEDDEEVRRITLRLLQMQGYHLLDAQHGDDARLMCEKYHKDIDLLITDMMLPDITGPELTARLKKLRPKIKVLYISGYSNAAEVKTLNGGEDIQRALLEKPFTVDALARKVREILDR